MDNLGGFKGRRIMCKNHLVEVTDHMQQLCIKVELCIALAFLCCPVRVNTCIDIERDRCCPFSENCYLKIFQKTILWGLVAHQASVGTSSARIYLFNPFIPDGPYGPMTNTVKYKFLGGKVQNIVNFSIIFFKS